ncbi:MAG: phage head-tail adapter protein [Sphingomonadales bacterium]|nr:MAG: phage head-tail adapter protein [Sphingomonadales bacterium]
MAQLFEVSEAETPYGGLSATYEPLGYAWLKVGSIRRRERGEAGTTALAENLAAETRTDIRLVSGRMLRFDGADWRIVSGETVGGRALLNLERAR